MIPIHLPKTWKQEAQILMRRPEVSPSELVDAQLVGIGRSRSRKAQWEQRLREADSEELGEVLMRSIGARQDPSKVRPKRTHGLPSYKMSANQNNEMAPGLAGILGGLGAGGIGAGLGSGIQFLRENAPLSTTPDAGALPDTLRIQDLQRELESLRPDFRRVREVPGYVAHPIDLPFETDRAVAVENLRDRVRNNPSLVMRDPEAARFYRDEYEVRRANTPADVVKRMRRKQDDFADRATRRLMDEDLDFQKNFVIPERNALRFEAVKQEIGDVTDDILRRGDASNLQAALSNLADEAASEAGFQNARRLRRIGTAGAAGAGILGLLGAAAAHQRSAAKRRDRLYGFDQPGVAKLSRVRDAQFVGFGRPGMDPEEIYLEKHSPNARVRGLRALGAGAGGAAAGAGIGALLGRSRGRGAAMGALLGGFGGAAFPGGVTRATDTRSGDIASGQNRRRAKYLANVLDAGSRPGNTATMGFDPGTMEQSLATGRRFYGSDTPLQAYAMDVDDAVREDPAMRASLLG